MRGLVGKTELVTGDTSGICQAIAVRFAGHGANVAGYITGQTIVVDGGLTLFAGLREPWLSA
jgi:NAD(P)-dependent dehydrogenase (short-subunit alcohol dehydrogenase family)